MLASLILTILNQIAKAPNFSAIRHDSLLMYGTDCGIYVIANAQELCAGRAPGSFGLETK